MPMIIEEDLIENLEKLGIPINKRALTDWRQKHYLPPLKSHGRGRGQGKVYYWSDQEVIQQAVLVDEMMLAEFQGKRINLILWFLGYEVPVSLIRNILLKGIDKFELLMTGGNRSGDKIEDYVSGFISKYNRLTHKYPQFELPSDQRPGEMEILINILVNPEFDLNEIPYMEGARAFIQRLGGSKNKEKEEEDVSLLSPADVEEALTGWTFFRNIFFIGHLKEALVEASEERMRKVQTDISQIFSELGKLFGGIPAFEGLREHRFHAVNDFGVILTCVDLAIRHAGWDEFLDKQIPTLPEYIAKLNYVSNNS